MLMMLISDKIWLKGNVEQICFQIALKTNRCVLCVYFFILHMCCIIVTWWGRPVSEA